MQISNSILISFIADY